MRRILVTGGAGFVGSHIAEGLLNAGSEVVVLDDLSGGYADNVPQQAHFVEGSVNDVQLVDRIFKEWKFDYVYHLAAYAAEGLSHFIKRFNYENNLIGSVNLINAAVANDTKCFVFTSSIAVYGTSPELPMTEETQPHPEDSYGIAKLAVEQELRASKEMFGLDYVIFRPHNVYGPRQNIGDKYRNVVGIFMNQILKGMPMTVFGDGRQTRAFSFIDDIVPAMVQAINVPEAYGEIFNIGADQPCTVNELAQAVASSMGVMPNVVHLPARNEVMEAYSSHEKLARVFGEREPHSLEDGLAVMAKWVRRHGARESQEFSSIELTKNFPAAWMPAQ